MSHLNKTVLVIDDYATMVRILRNMLIQVGLEKSNIDTAASGTEGIEKIEAKKYDLIICDFNMEGITGLDVLKALRASKNDTKFVLVLGDRFLNRATRGLPDAFMVKPFGAPALTQVVDGLIGESAPA
jgi:two-component system, chemotaxis family, chemotaxis protein CheY